MYDVIVLGAGPAGLAAAAVTLRYQLSTLVIAPDLAGRAAHRLRLPWLTQTETIVGENTVERLRQQLITMPQLTRFHDVVEQVFLHNQAFQVITGEGGAFEAHALVVATGVQPRPLGVPGEQRLMGYGLSYSATSHAHLFVGRRVAVVGSDLRALRAAAELSAIAEHVTLVVPDQLRLNSYMLGRRLLHEGRVTLLADYLVQEITGESTATGLLVVAPDGTPQHIAVDGIFIEHGLIAQSAFLGSLVERTTSGQIVVDERGATRLAGLFAAGDITSSAYAEQILIALGEGTKAGISACVYVLEQAIGGQEHVDERTVM
jgi:thioredoxin reductase